MPNTNPPSITERRVADPVIDFSLFRQRAFVAGSLLTACQNFAMYSILFELPQVAGRLFASSPKDVGRTLLAMMGTMVLASPVAGRLADRFGGRTIAIVGSFVALGGMVLLAVRDLTALSDATPALVSLGAGMGLTASPSQSIAISDVAKEKSGMAAGIASTLRYIGGIAGVTMLSLVLTDEPKREVVLRQHHGSVLLFCVALVLATICAFRLVPTAASEPVSQST
jgi:MFS family permease